MTYRRLGKSNLDVSVAGLGCGGPSRLGTRLGKTADEAADLVRLAIDLGVNFFDTAESYGTERAVGLGIQGSRDRLIISTKASLRNEHEEVRTKAQILSSIEASLKSLRTDHIDIFHFHGVTADELDHLQHTGFPAAIDAQRAGMIRHIAVSEAFARDTSHQMFQALFTRGLGQFIDVIMVGFNLLNPSARNSVLSMTQKQDMGVEIMFAVRRALSNPDRLRKTLVELADRGEIDRSVAESEKPLEFLLDDADSVTAAAYRFCAHEPGVHIVLSGTGDADHLRENVASIDAPCLPIGVQAQLRKIFGGVSSVSGS